MANGPLSARIHLFEIIMQYAGTLKRNLSE